MSLRVFVRLKLKFGLYGVFARSCVSKGASLRRKAGGGVLCVGFSILRVKVAVVVPKNLLLGAFPARVSGEKGGVWRGFRC
jgi:hypothetical protein